MASFPASPAELVVDARCRLGEGPIWDPRDGRVLWVDIEGRRLHWYRPADGTSGHWSVGAAPGAVGLRAEGGWIVADELGFGWLEPSGDDRVLTRHTVADVLAGDGGRRMNDGAVDPAGRFWAGSMAWGADAALGTLYRVSPEGDVAPALSGLAISNGIDWSPDGATLYFVDTPTHRIDAFRFDPAAGELHDRRPFAHVDPADGSPDGLTVDADGGVWVALWGGAEVRRYEPDGRLSDRVPLPAAHVTKPWFGGDALDELYVTTARPPDEGDLTDEAGGLFRLRTGHRGQAPRFFGRRPASVAG